MSTAPSVVTSGDTTNQLLLQAVMANMQPEQQNALQAQIAMQARKAANKRYLSESIRKFAPALTNGIQTQAFSPGQSNTFSLPQPNNAYAEGILVQLNVNYTLAAGTGATYAANACGGLGFIDTVEVKYNKSQIKMPPQDLRHLAMMGALEDYIYPSSVVAGQSQSYLQSWLASALPTAVGVQSFQIEFFLPFNLLGVTDDRGILPSMPGETGIQVIINAAQNLLGNDAAQNVYSASGGTGNAVTYSSGTVKVQLVYRDGDTYSQNGKLAFDMSVIDGTLQMQRDTYLTNLTANNILRGGLTIRGKHAYVLLMVIDAVSPTKYASSSNIAYLEASKDAVGANIFWKYGLGLNDFRDFLAEQRRINLWRQDLDEGIIPLIQAPLVKENVPGRKQGTQFLDNTPSGWPAFHYGIQLNSIGSLSGVNPRVEPHVYYINPVGLQTV